jgi:nucleotide-binding universal stress UspA family protein
MYRKILVALENSPTDAALVDEVTTLAKQLGSSLLLVHVADGWAARNYERMKLTESDEMREDRSYLDKIAVSLRAKGLTVSTHLALGDPAGGILRTGTEQGCDLLALASHGHRLIGDIIHGDTIEKVRHRATVPLFIVSPKK